MAAPLAPSEILVVIPTASERNRFLMQDPVTAIQKLCVPVRLCGFGLIGSGLTVSRLLGTGQFRAVLLAGIAGSLDPDLEPGSAVEFTQARCDGIGAGQGTAHESAPALGWEQFPGLEVLSSGRAVVNWFPDRAADPREILSVCAASASHAEAQQRRERFPAAVAEDMEAFSVAAACHLAGVRCHVVRGISNRAGERNQKNWQTGPAIAAAARLLADRVLELLERGLPDRGQAGRTDRGSPA